jgi:hypothetical protein
LSILAIAVPLTSINAPRIRTTDLISYHPPFLAEYSPDTLPWLKRTVSPPRPCTDARHKNAASADNARG